MSGQIAVTAEHVVKSSGQGASALRALDDVSLTIRSGEFFTLLGPLGCGKTTLLRLIAGFEMPSPDASCLTGKRSPTCRPGNTVLQSYALFPRLNVAENVGFGLRMQGRPRAEVAARMLALVKMAHRPAAGGLQQRVGLARALAPQHKVLLLDEPLSALDLKLRKEMQLELKRLPRETGITFVFVTHDQDEVLTMSDRIGVMSVGGYSRSPQRAIYTAPANRFVTSFVGETNFLPVQRGPDGALRLGGVAVVASGNGDLLTIRPKQIQLTAPGAAGAISARITELTYMGGCSSPTAPH